MKEYVLTISSRDPEHPIAMTTLIDLGFDASDERNLIEGVQRLATLLAKFRTPEKIVEFQKQAKFLQALERAN